MTDIRIIPLAAVTFSTTRAQTERRAHLDKAKLSELAESIKSHGLVQPILVRPLRDEHIRGEAWEVVAGERRVLAAKQAGLEEISATIRELTDEQVLELQLIENLQRQDLHELAEAEGYEALAKLGHTVDDMAAKVGKSRATIYARMKLLTLCKEARKAFYEGKLSASVALLLARIPHENLQKKALQDVLESSYSNSDGAMSYREAFEHIQREYTFRLDQAGFSTIDPNLVPSAGACMDCPKRTGNQRELFGDIKRADVCTDAVCFQEKRYVHSQRKLREAEAAGQQIIQGADAKKVTKYGTHSLQGGYARLDEHCHDDPKGRTYGQLLGKKATPALLVVPDSKEVIEIVDKSAVNEVLKERGIKVRAGSDYKSQQRSEDKRKKCERLFRRELFQAIREKVPAKLGRPELEQLAIALFDRLQHETRKQIFAIWEWEPHKSRSIYADAYKVTVAETLPGLTEANLVCFLHDCSLAEELTVYSFNTDKPERMLAAAKRLKVDPEKIRKELAAEQKAAVKKATKKK